MAYIRIKVPEEMLKAAQMPDICDRPYDLCHFCPFPGETCDGPNCLAMLYQRWVTWIKEWIKKRGLTRALIAEQSNHPLSTIHYVLSGSAKDIKVSTMADITHVVMGKCWGRYPCHFAAMLLLGELDESSALHDTEQLNQMLDESKKESQKKIDYLKQDVIARDKRISTLDDQLNEHRSVMRTYRRIIGALAIPTVMFFMYLVYDAMHPDFGVVSSIIKIFAN